MVARTPTKPTTAPILTWYHHSPHSARAPRAPCPLGQGSQSVTGPSPEETSIPLTTATTTIHYLNWISVYLLDCSAPCSRKYIISLLNHKYIPSRYHLSEMREVRAPSGRPLKLLRLRQIFGAVGRTRLRRACNTSSIPTRPG